MKKIPRTEYMSDKPKGKWNYDIKVVERDPVTKKIVKKIIHT